MSLRNQRFRRPSHSIDASVAYQRLQDGGITLIDVREASEWNAGHAPGARHMPLSRLDPAALPADRPVVTVRRSGRRSATPSASCGLPDWTS